MSTLLKRIEEALGDAPQLDVPPIVQKHDAVRKAPHYQPSNKLLRFLKRVENPRNQGRQGGVWTRIPDPAGGFTIGWGCQVQDRKARTDAEVNALLARKILDSYELAKSSYKNATGKDLAKLDQNSQDMLTALAFNAGEKVAQFKQFMGALGTNHIDVLRKESRTTSGGKPLVNRHKDFIATFLP